MVPCYFPRASFCAHPGSCVAVMVDEYISIARAREIFLEGMIAPEDAACPYEKRNERLMWEAGRSQELANASSGVKDAIHDGTVGQSTSE